MKAKKSLVTTDRSVKSNLSADNNKSNGTKRYKHKIFTQRVIDSGQQMSTGLTLALLGDASVTFTTEDGQTS